MIGKIILGLSLVGLGLKVIFVQKFTGRGGYVDFSQFYLYIPIGIVLIVLGGLLLMSVAREYKESKIPHMPTTKCPKCKEVFSYKDTIEGKCPYCQDVDTIDIKEYYKMFPDEKKSDL